MFQIARIFDSAYLFHEKNFHKRFVRVPKWEDMLVKTSVNKPGAMFAAEGAQGKKPLN